MGGGRNKRSRSLVRGSGVEGVGRMGDDREKKRSRSLPRDSGGGRGGDGDGDKKRRGT